MKNETSKIVLFALTGFGNSVLDSLQDILPEDNLLVITRQEKGPFPYYPCADLSTVLEKKRVRCLFDDITDKILQKEIGQFEPDFIIAATYHKLIPESIFSIAKKCSVNIHPGLLPNYRGPQPTKWAILFGEKYSGISIHQLTSDFDSGEIYWQEKCEILQKTDGELREELADLAGNCVIKFIQKFNSRKIEVIKQGENKGSYHPKIQSEKGIEFLKKMKFPTDRVVRAITPWPGRDYLKDIDYELSK